MDISINSYNEKKKELFRKTQLLATRYNFLSGLK